MIIVELCPDCEGKMRIKYVLFMGKSLAFVWKFGYRISYCDERKFIWMGIFKNICEGLAVLRWHIDWAIQTFVKMAIHIYVKQNTCIDAGIEA